MRSFLLLISILFNTVMFAQTRSVTILSDNWKFSKGKNEDAFQQDFNDKNWQTVSVPHDWAIYGPFDKKADKQTVAIMQNGEKEANEKTGRTGALPYIGEGWYRRPFSVPDFGPDKQVLIMFEGAMSEPKVYVNGTKVGEWNYGYNYFYFDITNAIKTAGHNTLAVNVSNRGQSSRWYPGAGLYRKVSLIVKNKESIEHWGTYITTPEISAEQAKVNIRTNAAAGNFSLRTVILNPKGDTVGTDQTSTRFGKTFEQNIIIQKPELWSPETPQMYKAVTRLYQGNRLKDEVVTGFGIREIKYSPGTGFSLNGKSRKFKGVCLHHDLGPLGAAINTAALRRQLKILKDMGCDAVRSSHNMPSLEQLELCDEMGLMFLAETFDEWAKPKVKNGYHRFFETDAEKDVVNLIHATRNHPCIVMWSSGNEVPDQHGSEGVKRAKWLQDIFHGEDPTRPVTVGMDQVKATMASGFGAILDVPGLNYRTHLYEDAYNQFPQGFILGSETASTVSSRGVYKFPVEKAVGKRYEDNQCSSYDMEYCSWSNLPEEDFILQDSKPWTIGEFVWTGFDYLGEPTPYDGSGFSRSSYFGINDLAGLPKDRFYLYRSRWNTKDTTLHILPHWNWAGREGQTTPVFVYTNFDSAELFINGKSMGIQKKNATSAQSRYRLMWMDVKYEPGTVKVIAYDKDGKAAAEKSIATAGKPYRLLLEADRQELIADGNDISFVTVSAVDKDGNLCPLANDQLNFKVSGNGKFRASCNGDATSQEQFHLPTMKLFNGKLVVLVQSDNRPGDIKLSVEAKGLKAGTMNFISKPALSAL